MAWVGQCQCIAQVERFGLPGTQFPVGQTETINYCAQYRGVLKDMMDPRLWWSVCGDHDRWNARSKPIEFETNAAGLSRWDNSIRGDGYRTFRS